MCLPATRSPRLSSTPLCSSQRPITHGRPFCRLPARAHSCLAVSPDPVSTRRAHTPVSCSLCVNSYFPLGPKFMQNKDDCSCFSCIPLGSAQGWTVVGQTERQCPEHSLCSAVKMGVFPGGGPGVGGRGGRAGLGSSARFEHL